MTLATAQRITTAEFEAFIALPENADRFFELIDGEIVAKTMPTEEHGYIDIRLALFIGIYLELHPEVPARLVANGRYRPTDDSTNDRLPDLALVMGDKPLTRRGVANFIPDICIETRSPDDSLKSVREKAAFYLAHGAKYALVILPDKRTIEVYAASGDDSVLVVGDDLTFPDLLPGFSVPLEKLFPPPEQV
jgi:Uma2 family endonuclease